MKCARFFLFGLVMMALVPASANAWNATAGWTRADVGLDKDGDGLWLGFGNRTNLTSVLDLSWSVDYLQKKGSQPMTFSDPVSGFVTADAEVTTHWIQPSAYLGAGLRDMVLRPRIYLGFGFGLKWKEKWSDFPGEPSTELAYEDSDFVGSLGVTVGLGPLDLDVRYTQGFSKLLIEDETERGTTKAEDDLPGVTPPEIGAKISTFQLGLAYTF